MCYGESISYASQYIQQANKANFAFYYICIIIFFKKNLQVLS